MTSTSTPRRHAFGVPGMTAAESETFLAELLAQAVQPPRILAHQVQVKRVMTHLVHFTADVWWC
jgi:hypothetical protein